MTKDQLIALADEVSKILKNDLEKEPATRGVKFVLLMADDSLQQFSVTFGTMRGERVRRSLKNAMERMAEFDEERDKKH